MSAGGLEHWRIVYLDGVHFSIRHGDQCDSTIILTALGVDLAGNKEVLADLACAEEDKDGWACLLHDLRSRGATHIDLFVTDGHDGRLSAVSEQFTATPRQRCLVHKQRNVLNAIPRRERPDVQVELVGIWEQPTKEEALICLAADHQPSTRCAIPKRYEVWPRTKSIFSRFMLFPRRYTGTFRPPMPSKAWEVNVRQRTDQIDMFTTETSCLTIVWATMQDIRLHKISLQ